MLTYLPHFVLAITVLGLSIIGCTFAYCAIRRRHTWAPWAKHNLQFDKRACRICGRRQFEKSEYWLGITAPSTGPASGPPESTSPSAETAEIPSVSSETGTSEIPLLPTGERSGIPTLQPISVSAQGVELSYTRISYGIDVPTQPHRAVYTDELAQVTP